MKKTEITKLLALIRSNYSNFEITDEKKVLWHRLMEQIPFEKAVQNAEAYMSISSYPPVAADIIRKDTAQFVDYQQQLIDTELYLQQRAERQQKAISCPPHLLRQQIKAGDSDE